MIFEKLSFDANDYKSAVVDGKTLFIYLYSMNDPVHVDYKNATEAVEALKRLDAEVTANRSARPILKEGTETTGKGFFESKPTLFNVFEGLFNKGKEKVDDVVNGTSLNALILQMAADQAINSVKAKAEDLSQKLEEALQNVSEKVSSKKVDFETTFEELMEVITEMQRQTAETETPEAPEEKRTGWTRHMTNGKTIFKGDFFSGLAEQDPDVPEPGSVGAPDEPLIGDLTSPELKELIAKFVDGAMANPKTQKIFGNIYELFGEKEATAAVENLKKLIYEMAVNCPDDKLSDVLQRFLG